MAESGPRSFIGSKLALLCDGSILVYRRDDRADIPFPDCWDLPGGGREGDETPEACVLRETFEEFGLVYAAKRLIWSRPYPSWRDDGSISWFFGGRLTHEDIAAIRFGDEGQHWTMMPVADYLASPDAVPHHRDHVRDLLAYA